MTASDSRSRAQIVKPLQFDDKTPQTTGMHRLAAVSNALVGSEKLWAGVMLAEPNTVSSVHHHGPLETVVYVAEGRSTLRWGRRLEHETELEAGDFLFLPPFLPHQEINPSPDQPALWIVVRSAPESVVVELALGAGGEYVAPDSGEVTRSLAGESDAGQGALSRAWLAAATVAVVGAAVADGLLVWSAARVGHALLLTGGLALLGVVGMVWTSRARAARHLAALDAFAEREISRSHRDPH